MSNDVSHFRISRVMTDDSEFHVTHPWEYDSYVLPAEKPHCAQRISRTMLKIHLPIALVVAAIVGLSFPSPGKVVGTRTPLSTICIVGIFFIYGVQLKSADFHRAKTAWKTAIVGFLSILVISPLLGFGLVEVPFRARELAVGLAVLATMPTTISSSVVLSKEAGGNVILALCFAVVSNLLGTLTAPLFLSVILASSNGDDSIEVGSLLLRLSLIIIAPLVVGKGVNLLPCVPPVLVKILIPLQLLSSFLLVLIPCVMSLSLHVRVQYRRYLTLTSSMDVNSPQVDGNERFSGKHLRTIGRGVICCAGAWHCDAPRVPGV